ncbi:MAG: PQQ-binding-like beta-propeller repeat protein [Mycobacteriales bacterium]
MSGSVLAVSAALALALAGCGDDHKVAVRPSADRTAAPAPGASPGDAPGDWPTYHRDNARTGVAADLPALGTLAVGWHAALDGAVYGQPLYVGGTVYAATENDTVYALDGATGAVKWSRHVGTPIRRSALPCGNIDPLGITSTMAYDAGTGRLFALAETDGGHHTLVGVNAGTGAVEVSVAAEPPKGDPIAHQQRSALTVLNGRVYVAYGGLAGDCAQYIGSVVSLTTAGTGRMDYAVPTPREGGIWAPGGASVSGDRLLYPVGNGESSSGYDGSDSVIALSAADLTRQSFFAPSTWADDNNNDLDLGSLTPAIVGTHILIAGKRGTGYVLDGTNLGGVGGELGQATVCKSYGGPSVDGDTAYLPCTDGTRAVTIGTDNKPQVRWHTSVHAAGSPVVGGGAVWVVDYAGGVLYALDPATGSTRAQVSIGTAPHFASPTLAGGRAYVGVTDGVVAVTGA